MRLLLFIALAAANLSAQGLDPGKMLAPPVDTWPTYNGDYTGRRFSPLDRINQSNVQGLMLAWAFQTHSVSVKATPLEVNGVLYFCVPDHFWAIDATAGRQVWHYSRPSQGDGMYRDRLFFGTSDAHVIALDARNGKQVWDTVVADVTVGYYVSAAPLIVGGLLKASRNGYYFVLDRETGKNLLTASFTETDWAARVDDRGRPIPAPEKEPQRDGVLGHANMDGATNWMAPSFDPQTRLFYVNTQDAWSLWYLVLNEDNKPDGHQGGTLSDFWSSSRLKALDYQTGKTVWQRDLGRGHSFTRVLTTAGHLLFSG